MFRRRARPSLRTAALAATVSAVLTTLVAVLCPGIATAEPPYTLDERSAAIATPSLVFLEVKLTGFMRIRSTGALADANSVSVYSRCSAFVVNPDGYAVTATHCLQPAADSLRGSASYVVAADLIKGGKLNAADKASYIKQLQATADFTGATPDAGPTTQLTAQMFAATAGVTGAPAISATLVDSQPVTDGDVALIKLAQKNLPTAQLDATTHNAGTHVVQAAFRTGDTNIETATFTVQSQPATITGTYGSKTIPMQQLDANLGTYAEGGMVIDSNGHVIGMVTADPAAKDRTNHLVSEVGTINRLLSSSGVKNTLGPLDQTYRAGLDSYFKGNYSDAITSFNTVIAALPRDQVAQSYRKQAQDRKAIEGRTGSGMPVWLLPTIVGGAVLIIVLVVVIIVMARRRSRFQREMLASNLLSPISGIPISAVPIPSSGAGSGAGGLNPLAPPPYRAGTPGPMPPMMSGPVQGGGGNQPPRRDGTPPVYQPVSRPVPPGPQPPVPPGPQRPASPYAPPPQVTQPPVPDPRTAPNSGTPVPVPPPPRAPKTPLPPPRQPSPPQEQPPRPAHEWPANAPETVKSPQPPPQQPPAGPVWPTEES